MSFGHVWLAKTAPLHVGTYGTYVTTAVANDRADITARTTVINEGTAAATFDVDQEILDDAGHSLATAHLAGTSLAAGLSTELPATLAVSHPRLWSVDTPVLHKLVTTVRRGFAAAVVALTRTRAILLAPRRHIPVIGGALGY